MTAIEPLNVHRAALSEPLSIEITDLVPDEEVIGTDELRRLFDREGIALASALHDRLPGGTFDSMISALLALKSSHFRSAYHVPWHMTPLTPPFDLSDSDSQGEQDMFGAKIRDGLAMIGGKIKDEAAKKESEAKEAPTPNEKIKILITRDVLIAVGNVFNSLSKPKT